MADVLGGWGGAMLLLAGCALACAGLVLGEWPHAFLGVSQACLLPPAQRPLQGITVMCAASA